jgi:hypothetical protein
MVDPKRLEPGNLLRWQIGKNYRYWRVAWIGGVSICLDWIGGVPIDGPNQRIYGLGTFRSGSPKINKWELEDGCPKCGEYLPAEDDYVCERCRYGS